MHRPGNDDPFRNELNSLFGGEAGSEERISAALTELLLPQAVSLLGSGGEAEDAVQDTLIRLLELLRRQGRFEGNLRNLARVALRNRCLQLIRNRRRRETKLLILSKESPPRENHLERLLRIEIFAGLSQGLATLDEPCRDLLRAIFFEKVPVRKLRRKLGLASVQGVYARKHGCLKRLRRIMEDALDLDG